MENLCVFDGNASHIQAGEYQLQGQEPVAWLQQWHSGDVIQHQFTIIEGSTWNELLWRLRHTTGIKRLSYQKAKELQQTGIVFPNSYHYPWGIMGERIVQMAQKRFKELEKKTWGERQAQCIKIPNKLVL